jgi:hypothetical protein
MPKCKDTHNDTGAILRGEVDPCPMKPGFASSDYRREVENTRSSKLNSVDVHSKPLHGYTDIDGRLEVRKHYAVIRKAGGRKPFTHKLIPNSGSNGQTEEVSTTAKFYDETLPTTQEALSTLCDFDIP